MCYGSFVTLASDEQLAAAWHALMGNYHRMINSLDRELKAAHDLSSSEFEVLQQLHMVRAAGPMRMYELGDLAHLSQSALSRLVSRLEREGLVERCMCADDRRSVTIEITSAGAGRYQEAQPTQRAILRCEGAGCIPTDVTPTDVTPTDVIPTDVA
jgi:DNA-binding MarR family transcriptional regulator